MGIIKSKPTVLKSKETVAEINSAAQQRLEARRKHDKDQESNLYGMGKKVLPKREGMAKTRTVLDAPRFIYK